MGVTYHSNTSILIADIRALRDGQQFKHVSKTVIEDEKKIVVQVLEEKIQTPSK